MLTWNNVMQFDSEQLERMLAAEFPVFVPEQIDSIEDMKKAQILLGEYASKYSFLNSMAVRVRGAKRRAKRTADSREEFELLLEREELLTAYADNMKIAYNAVSRMISVRMEIMNELRMTGSMP